METVKFTATEIPFSDSKNKTEVYFNVYSRRLARKRVRDCKKIQFMRRERETLEGNADLLDLYLAIIRVHVETERELSEYALQFNSNFKTPLDREDVLKAAQYTFCFRDEDGNLCRQEVNAARAVSILNLTEDEQEQLETLMTPEMCMRLHNKKRKNPEPTKEYKPCGDLKVFEIDPDTMPEQDRAFMEKHKMYQAKKKGKKESSAHKVYSSCMIGARMIGKSARKIMAASRPGRW